MVRVSTLAGASQRGQANAGRRNRGKRNAAKEKKAKRVQERKATSSLTEAAKNADPNPRAIQNQASATRPDGVIPRQNLSSPTPQNSRINSRRAEQQVEAQNTVRARSLLGVEGTERRAINDDRINELQNRLVREGNSMTPDQRTGLENQIKLLGGGVGVPSSGFQGEGAGTAFDTLEDAQDAAREEYRQTGTVSPETEAAIERFTNPDAIRVQSGGRTGRDVVQGLVDQAQGPTERVGVAGANGIPGAGISSTESAIARIDEQLAGLTGTTQITRDGGKVDVQSSIINDVAREEKRALLLEQRNTLLERQRQEEAQRAVQGAERNVDFQVNDAALQNVLNALPDGQLMASGFQGLLNALGDAEDTAAINRGAEINSAERGYGRFQDVIDRSAARSQGMFDSISGFVDQSAERSEKALAKKKDLTLKRLKSDEMRTVRDARTRLRESIEEQAAGLALSGAAFSPNANRSLKEAEREGEQAILEMQKEFAFKREDVEMFYTEQLNASNEKWGFKYLEAMQAHKADLDRFDSQEFAAAEKTESRIDKADEAYRNILSNLKMQQAKEVKGFAQEVRSAINQERNFKRQDETNAWAQVKWLKSMFGSNVPQSLSAGIQEKLPGVDVAALLAAPTLDEIADANKAASGFSFDFSDLNSLGEPPTFDEYMDDRLAEHENSLSQSLTPDERTKFRNENRNRFQKEYEAKVGTLKRYDPATLLLRLTDRTRNSAKHIRENASSQVKNFITQGRYEEASRFIDGIGARISATERNDYIQALNARSNIARISELMEEFGQQGPVTGRLRDANLWDLKNAELNSLITQTVPGLARGIFKEVGVLTDTDIERYTQTIANGKATVAQGQALTKNLLETIDISLQNQIDIHDSAGLDIRDVRQRVDSSSSGGSTGVQPTSADYDYISTLNL